MPKEPLMPLLEAAENIEFGCKFPVHGELIVTNRTSLPISSEGVKRYKRATR